LHSSPAPPAGIGLELARQFAEHGFDLIVAAEDDEIQRAASELGNGAQWSRSGSISPGPTASRVCTAR
jgi:NAD(P)-dependent dehydrogenase (short-subunit alcohol dehydrogenase family)